MLEAGFESADLEYQKTAPYHSSVLRVLAALGERVLETQGKPFLLSVYFFHILNHFYFLHPVEAF